MRRPLVGLIFLLISGSASYAQPQGFVEKIGFGKNYRPYGWTPVLVQLIDQTAGKPQEYRIEVRQEDLDRDRVIFRRDIVLNPQKLERFWVYFMAQPRGLPNGDPAALSQTLDVRLAAIEDGKPIVKLDIKDPIFTLDPPRQAFEAHRGVKLVLMVTDGSSSSSTPAVREFETAIGSNEKIQAVTVTPFDLPENVVGYDAVDAVVWLDADSGQMTSGGSKRLAAMTEWVRAGGRLVVCQPAEQFKTEGFADLLPVVTRTDAGDNAIELRDRSILPEIRALAEYHMTDITPEADELRRSQRVRWNEIERRGPFKVGFAQLRPDAVGEIWIDWKGDQSQMSPWLARRPAGLGSVSWVAQDLGNPALTSGSGWAYVWDRVLGMRNDDMRVAAEFSGDERHAERARDRYESAASVDVGASFLRAMEHEGRAGGLIFLAGIFFVGYWVVAGPVSYFVLAGRKRTHLSWQVFAVSALAATLLTVGVVRLVLRGDPEVHHVSLVRVLPPGAARAEDGTPINRAVVSSRIGLYIPRDGEQRVKMLGNDRQALSYLSPFSVHPAHHSSTTEFPAYLNYTVMVRDNPLTEDVNVTIPYRSTLKKIEARWVGDLRVGIDVVTTAGGYEANKPRLRELTETVMQNDANGKPQPVRIGTINGRLVNRTGGDLAHVYFAFNYPATFQGMQEYDIVLYKPLWPRDQHLDLTREFNDAAMLPLAGLENASGRTTPGSTNKRSIQDRLTAWTAWWFLGLRPTTMSDQLDDARNDFLRAFPLVSLYDRVKPLPNPADSPQRVELLRRAAREWDISELVAAGQLVILAQAGQPGATVGQAPLPFPLEVEGEAVSGTGVVFYQFALPLDRSGLPKPWTQPDAEDLEAVKTELEQPKVDAPNLLGDFELEPN